MRQSADPNLYLNLKRPSVPFSFTSQDPTPTALSETLIAGLCVLKASESPRLSQKRSLALHLRISYITLTSSVRALRVLPFVRAPASTPQNDHAD